MLRRRGHVVPVLLVALFVLGVCVVSLAHADARGTDSCTVATQTALSSSTAPGDVTATPVGAVRAPTPAPVSSLVALTPAAAPLRQASAGPRSPRAPPRA